MQCLHFFFVSFHFIKCLKLFFCHESSFVSWSYVCNLFASSTIEIRFDIMKSNLRIVNTLGPRSRSLFVEVMKDFDSSLICTERSNCSAKYLSLNIELNKAFLIITNWTATCFIFLLAWCWNWAWTIINIFLINFMLLLYFCFYRMIYYHIWLLAANILIRASADLDDQVTIVPLSLLNFRSRCIMFVINFRQLVSPDFSRVKFPSKFLISFILLRALHSIRFVDVRLDFILLFISIIILIDLIVHFNAVVLDFNPSSLFIDDIFKIAFAAADNIIELVALSIPSPFATKRRIVIVIRVLAVRLEALKNCVERTFTSRLIIVFNRNDFPPVCCVCLPEFNELVLVVDFTQLMLSDV